MAGLPYGAARGVYEAFGAIRGGSRLTGQALADLVRQATSLASGRPAAAASAHLARQGRRHGGQQQRRRPGAAVGRSARAARGRTIRSVWRDAQGEAAIEMNLAQGAMISRWVSGLPAMPEAEWATRVALAALHRVVAGTAIPRPTSLPASQASLSTCSWPCWAPPLTR